MEGEKRMWSRRRCGADGKLDDVARMPRLLSRGRLGYSTGGMEGFVWDYGEEGEKARLVNFLLKHEVQNGFP